MYFSCMVEQIDTQFPQYRKLSNDKVFYRIDSIAEFTELTLFGNRSLVHNVKAIQYPEKLRILDMLKCGDPFLESTEIEFNSHWKDETY